MHIIIYCNINTKIYGLLAIIGATIGNHFCKKNGFSDGYVVGTALSLVLWFTAGRKMAGV